MARIFSRIADNSRSNKFVYDEEFGRIRTKRNARAIYVRLKVNQQGELEATLPLHASERSVSLLLNNARDEIRKLLSKHAVRQPSTYEDGQAIGHSHKLNVITAANGKTPKRSISHQALTVVLPQNWNVTAENAQGFIRESVRKVLDKEARAYLPRRLSYLADAYGMTYESVRFANQKGRWGSCSSHGTISLNVGLMGLSLELIDYVLIHELCHTKQMNHSKDFWDLVESCLPDYRERRKALKNENPTH